MIHFPEGNAVVYCEGAYASTYGKTAHGLVRRSERYRIEAVIDSSLAGQDAGTFLDGIHKDIPLLSNLPEALELGRKTKLPLTHFIFGIAPDGGRMNHEHRKAVQEAVCSGLNIDSGLHDYLTEDHRIMELAASRNVKIRDIRKPPPSSRLHFFSGKIDEVKSLKIAVLGTDSAVGKRTTAWILLDGLRERMLHAELVGTGQTAWMQGARYGIILDSLVNDFVSGEIEHAVWSAWNDVHPDVILIEGQGSLMNPAYPGGFEILAAARPDIIILQHAPARREYDGFPGVLLHPIDIQIRALELLSSKPVAAITINHENIKDTDISQISADIESKTGIPVFDVLKNGSRGLVSVVLRYRKKGQIS